MSGFSHLQSFLARRENDQTEKTFDLLARQALAAKTTLEDAVLQAY
jgi:hypothetical protein